MKILFVLDNFHPYIGGAEKLFQILVDGIVEAGDEVVVVTTGKASAKDSPNLSKGLRINRTVSSNRFIFIITSIPKIFREARSADVIHTSSFVAALPAWLVAKLRRKPVVVTFHEVWGGLWDELPFMNFVFRKLCKFYESLLLNLKFNKFIAVSEATRSQLIRSGVNKEDIEVFYNGAFYSEFEKYKYRKPEKFTYTFVGRLGVSKGLDILLESAAIFQKKVPSSKLQMVIPKQPKRLYDRILSLVDEFDLAEIVEFYHDLEREDLFSLLSNSSCVVIPSYSEGFCYVALEAAALGVPIVSSGKGALPEVVSGKTLECSGLNSESLSEALHEAFLENWSLIPSRFFPIEQTLKSYRKLYADLCCGARRLSDSEASFASIQSGSSKL